MTLTKNERKATRRHIMSGDRRPICGGGYLGKTAQYQIDMGADPNCKACLKIALSQIRIISKPAAK
jgi:hypothetical protein